MYLQDKEKQGLTAWFKGGEPLIWMNAAAVTVSTLAVIGLLILLAVRGFSHFWPADVFVAEYQLPDETPAVVMAERVESEDVAIEQLLSAGFTLDTDEPFIQRELVKVGNRDVSGADFKWVLSRYLQNTYYPEQAIDL